MNYTGNNDRIDPVESVSEGRVHSGISPAGAAEDTAMGRVMANRSEYYCDLYREMAELIGDTAVRKLWKVYGGLSVSFPTRLYSSTYRRAFIQHHMDDMKPAEIAQELQLTERRVRQIMREIRQENGEAGEHF